LTRTYTIVLDPDVEEGGYTVLVPALPGCVTQGKSVEQCVERAQEAIALHIAALLEDGESVPEEQEHPQLLTVTVPA
jgi:predicted RNase H-like HicB family nuclease